MEHWLAAGLALTIGAATVATGTGLSRYSIDQNHQALDPGTTMAASWALVGTARDYMLAAEVLWSIGAAIAAIGLTWVIVLSFSTPTPPTPAAATTPSASLRLTPLGVSLEGRF
jgi:tellurite resistance protein TehA-like permease